MDIDSRISGFWQCLGRLWRMVGKDNAGRVAIRCMIGVVRIAASLSFVWISKRLVDIATGNIQADLKMNILLMVAILLIQVSNNVLAGYYEGLILVKVENTLRYKLFSHVMHSRWNGRDILHSGDTVNRLETDITTISGMVVTNIPDIIITVCQLVCASAFLFIMKPGLLWVLLAIMIVAIISSRLFFARIRRLSAEIRAKDAEIQSYMQENLLHRVLALTLIGVDRVTGRMGRLQDELYDVNVKRLNFNSVARIFMSLGFSVGYMSAFLWGVLGIHNGTVTFGMMTAFLQLVGQVQGPIAQIARYIPAMIHSLASVDRLSELEDLETEPAEDSVLLQDLPGIQIDNISFGYEKDKPVIENFSCIFQPGSMTAVMGPTGAGKSTLIRLILGLMTPEKGSIRIYDENLSVNAGPSARCNFMYVPQGNSMMSGSIRDNFLMANPDATESEMIDALRHACAQFVLELPDGLDTMCSELGAGLSEGQAQRIAIARALLHKGQILILDESTSALDSATEDQILADIRHNLQGKRTIIFITHRQTVADVADAVVRLHS